MRTNQSALCLGCRRHVPVGDVTARAGQNGQYVLCASCVEAGFKFKRMSEIYVHMQSRKVMLFAPSDGRWHGARIVKGEILKECAQRDPQEQLSLKA